MKAPASTIIIMGLVLFTRDNFTNTQQTTVKNWLNTNKNVMANEGRGKQRSTNGKPWEQKTKKKKVRDVKNSKYPSKITRIPRRESHYEGVCTWDSLY